MNTFVKYLLYFIIFVKIIFILTIIRYKITLSYVKDDKKAKKIKERNEVFHEFFVFLTYILLILLFNPTNKDIRLDKDHNNSHHLQVVVFALGIVQLLNFDYSKIFKAPQELIHTF